MLPGVAERGVIADKRWLISTKTLTGLCRDLPGVVAAKGQEKGNERPDKLDFRCRSRFPDRRQSSPTCTPCAACCNSADLLD